MEIIGQLKDDILGGKAVLFLGAGASIAAGLYGATNLANYLFEKTENHQDFLEYKDDLPRLVAKIDLDPRFTRRWVNKQMIEYFQNRKNYKNLEYHKKIFQLRWQGLFTTNYDMCMEFAHYEAKPDEYRLLPIVSKDEQQSMYTNDEGKLKYFKIHGCCGELDNRPSTAPPLVPTCYY